MEIKKLSEDKYPKLNILVYGPSGNGKTRFGGTVAMVAKPLIASAESGLLSLRKLREELKVDFDYVDIKDFAELEEVYRYFKSPECRHDALVLDSLTEIQQVCMDSILKSENREKAQMQDWGTLNIRMTKMIRSFRDLGIHFVVTALSAREKDEETQSFVSQPLLQGKLQDTVAGYFDEVFYLHSAKVKDAQGKEEVRRWLQTQGTNKIQAKDRSGRLPAECPASFGYVYKTIVGEAKPAVAPVANQTAPRAQGVTQ